MKVIAIDPGYERLGVAVLDKENGGKEMVLYSNCFKTSAEIPFEERLLLIGNEVKKIIKEHNPEILSIESLFLKSNQKTVMGVSQVRGVVIYEAIRAGLKIFEPTPLQVKIAVTGYGRADKNQITMMVRKLVVLDPKIKSDDEVDAIAIGLTCLAFNKK